MITQNIKPGMAAVTVIAVLALLVRVWGTSFGLPYDFTADEPHQILQALKIGAGEGGPLVQMWHTIGKGGLDYLLFFEYSLLFCFWWVTGKVGGANDFALAYLTDPSAFYLLGRITVASLGALTCVAVYGVGRRLYGPRSGLLAALIGALALDHATNSHLINVHIPMACALWLAVWCYAEYEHRPSNTRLCWTGVLAGLAISLAYNAAIGLLMLLLAIAMRRDTVVPLAERVAAAARVLGAALLTVLLLSPDLLLGAGALLENFHQVLGSAAGEPQAPANATRAAIDAVTILREQSWRDYLPILVGWRYLPVMVVALVGGVVGLVRGERWSWLLVGANLLLIAILSAADRGVSERYMLPMTPALWLLAARGVVALGGRRGWLQALLVCAVVAPSAFLIVKMDYTLTRTDSRVQAKQWLEAQVPAGARLLVDGMRFRYIQSPPLKPSAAALERQIANLHGSEPKYPKRFIDLYRAAKASLPGPSYDLHSTVYGLEVGELDDYVRACFDYVVTSSDVAERYAADPLRTAHPRTARFYDGLRSHPAFREVYRVSGAPWVAPGPTITIYAITSACANRSQSLPVGQDR